MNDCSLSVFLELKINNRIVPDCRIQNINSINKKKQPLRATNAAPHAEVIEKKKERFTHLAELKLAYI
jgi:hypothetical protein